jgi:hypothetical protein
MYHRILFYAHYVSLIYAMKEQSILDMNAGYYPFVPQNLFTNLLCPLGG